MGYVSEERRHDGITPGMSVKENMILPSYGQMTKNGLIVIKKLRKSLTSILIPCLLRQHQEKH